MPLVTAVLAVFRIIRQLVIGEDNAGSGKICIEDYREEFILHFPTILSALVGKRASIPRLKIAYDHLEKSLKYNAIGGKMTNGLMVVTTLSQLYGNRPLSTEEKHLAFTLGWCVEMIQASNFLVDDIANGCETRLDKPCWYKQENIGMIAINDSFWLNSLTYALIISKFRDHPCYIELIDLFHQVTEYAELGDVMAKFASYSKADLNNFTMESLQTTTKYRRGYFYFYLPVMAALYMAEINGTAVTEAALSVLLAIGEFYQYQADFNNCFGGVENVKSDIQGKKCTWLIVQALNMANTEQKAVLEANYGKSDKECVEKVKEVYEALNLRQLFAEYEEQSYQNIGKLINKHSSVLPVHVFLTLRDTIYNRH